MNRFTRQAVVLAALVLFACGGRGAAVQRQVHVGMTIGEVLQVGSGWLSCVGHPEPPTRPDARVRVTSDSLEVEGMGEADVTFHHGSPAELADALTKVVRGHGRWTFTFGYVATPRREYFDVAVDSDAKVVSVSPVRAGTLD